MQDDNTNNNSDINTDLSNDKDSVGPAEDDLNDLYDANTRGDDNNPSTLNQDDNVILGNTAPIISESELRRNRENGALPLTQSVENIESPLIQRDDIPEYENSSDDSEDKRDEI